MVGGHRVGKRDLRADLRADEARALCESSPDAVLFLDAARQRIDACNQAAVEFFGYEREDLIGKPVELILTAASMATALDAVDTGSVDTLELEGIASNGRTLSLAVMPRLLHLAGGARVGMYVRDRSIWLATKAQLMIERNFREAVEGTDDLVAKVDAGERFVYVNHSAERYLGLPPQECVGLPAWTILHPDDVAAAQARYRTMLANRGRVASFDNRTVSRTGQIFRMLWTTNIHYDASGNFLGTWSIARDITHRQELEEAERRHLEAQAELIAERARAESRREILHRSIAAQEEERRRIARELHREAGRTLIRITTKIQRIENAPDLDTAVLESRSVERDLVDAIADLQQLAARLRPTALEELGLERAVDALARNADATLERRPIPYGLDPACETVIYRVVEEALLNATRHAHGRNVTVRLESDERWLRATVDDDGKGFDMTHLDCPCDGLTGMRERAHAVGGRLSIDSSPGNGTRVQLEIPLDDALMDDCRSTEVVLAAAQPIMRTGLRGLLDAQDGFDVVAVAGNAAELDRKLHLQKPRIVVLDMDGWPRDTAATTVARIVNGSTRTRTVVLSSDDDVESVRAMLRAGAHAYLLKDADTDELVEAIRRVEAGETYVQPTLGVRLSREPGDGRRPNGPLSEREIDIVRLLALGHTNQEIANELFLSVRTVEAHRTKIQQKLGLSSRSELVRYALERRLLRL